jgi:hypothetical protein
MSDIERKKVWNLREQNFVKTSDRPILIASHMEIRGTSLKLSEHCGRVAVILQRILEIIHLLCKDQHVKVKMEVSGYNYDLGLTWSSAAAAPILSNSLAIDGTRNLVREQAIWAVIGHESGYFQPYYSPLHAYYSCDQDGGSVLPALCIGYPVG